MQRFWRALVGLTLINTGVYSPLLAQVNPPPESFTAEAWNAVCEPSSGWVDPGPPFRVHGNTYHVGTCGIMAILIAGEQGHVLIDSGPEEAAPIVQANIRALGFNLTDIKLLLHTQEHFDHVGALAHLQGVTGARLLASKRAAPVMATGRLAERDPQFGLDDPFPGARVDGLVQNGQPVMLGDLRLTPVETPGHSFGALAWQWKSCEDNNCLTILFTDGMAPMKAPSYRFSDDPDYLAQFRRSLDWLANAEADICLTPHPAASVLHERISTGKLIDPTECRAYATDIRADLERKVAAE